MRVTIVPLEITLIAEKRRSGCGRVLRHVHQAHSLSIRAAIVTLAVPMEVGFVSIIRIGLSESKKFAEGYDAIFGTKKKEEEKPKAKAEAKGGKKKAKKGKKS
jgi:hypothetical protein